MLRCSFLFLVYMKVVVLTVVFTDAAVESILGIKIGRVLAA